LRLGIYNVTITVRSRSHSTISTTIARTIAPVPAIADMKTCF
jgi:hypothetical protein